MLRRLYILLTFGLVACGGAEPLPTRSPTAVFPAAVYEAPGLPPTRPLPGTITAVTASPPPAARLRLGAGTAVPAELVAAAQKTAQQNLAAFTWTETTDADVALTLAPETEPLAQWIYVVAAPFATLAEEYSWAALQARWQNDLPGQPLLASAATAAALTPQLGPPGPQVHIVAKTELVAALWGQRPSLPDPLAEPPLAILPFHQLTPALKPLALDGLSPLAPGFMAEAYPLRVAVGVAGEATAVRQFLAAYEGPVTNREEGKLTRVSLTGVTALVRATAYNMEQFGILWPGEEVGPVLRAADIAHISHEVSFAPDCPYPNPVGGTTFCARDTYLGLIEEIGADVLELTGNHLNDWGQANARRTVDLYQAAGLLTYGGGRSLDEAAQPALFEHNGNRIAFVGCNSFGPAYAWATATGPGAMPCDGSLPAQIAQLRAEGYLVLATLQFTEHYGYAAPADQVAFFEAVAAAGATAVSGSQGHHAQGFAFHGEAFIHYGLGNLFFDQMDQLGTRQTFVDTYVMYDGRLLSVELWTGLIEHYARPRLMTPAERVQLLTAVFQASGW